MADYNDLTGRKEDRYGSDERDIESERMNAERNASDRLGDDLGDAPDRYTRDRYLGSPDYTFERSSGGLQPDSYARPENATSADLGTTSTVDDTHSVSNPYVPRVDRSETYSNPTEYGSEMADGPGYGNKTSGGEDIADTSMTRLGSASSTDAYSGQTEYGSGTTAGPGAGNKTMDHSSSSDSTIGKMMEKGGSILGNEKMETKGREKREAAGYGQE